MKVRIATLLLLIGITLASWFTPARAIGDIGGAARSVVDLATAAITGVLPVANGGTGAATLASAGICTVAGGSGCPTTVTTHTYAATVNLDFAVTSLSTVNLAGVLTLTTSNLAAGRSHTIRMVGDGSSRALTLPDDWDFAGAVEPATLAANKVGLLSLLSFGTTDADIVAAYSVEP